MGNLSTDIIYCLIYHVSTGRNHFSVNHYAYMIWNFQNVWSKIIRTFIDLSIITLTGGSKGCTTRKDIVYEI